MFEITSDQPMSDLAKQGDFALILKDRIMAGKSALQ
jgi:hypothetical protein